ncbi:uncharacterized protein MONOS_17115 [Monocercomonoides exilis]|uniref:uncharacterized protein n=1 Tax=Monocercomonoides exilis TaxID=2049356 RepID=UPI003559D364|nr:hypothetical protein MONOS_17115 [Monocercomonoides exilis]
MKKEMIEISKGDVVKREEDMIGEDGDKGKITPTNSTEMTSDASAPSSEASTVMSSSITSSSAASAASNTSFPPTTSSSIPSKQLPSPQSPGKSVRTAASTHAPNKFSPQIKLSRRARTTTRTSKLLKAANLLQNNTTSASAASSSTSASSSAGFPTASFPISNAQAKNPSSSSSSSSSVSLLSIPSTAFGRALKRSGRRKALAAFKRTVRMKTHTGSRIAPPEFKSEVLGLTNKMGGSSNNSSNNNNNSKKKKLLRVGMWQVPLNIPHGRPPKMRKKKMMTAMGLSQQGKKSEG